jgi:hypothetical protein
MSDKIRKDLTRPELGKAFRRVGKQKAATEYEEAQEAFWKNYERLKAERLTREAAKSKEK